MSSPSPRARAGSNKLAACGLLLMFAGGGLTGCRDASPVAPASSAARTAPSVKHEITTTTDNRPAAIRFASMLLRSGIDFVHHSGNSAERPFPAANGSGVGVIDYDRDGWCDLYFATGTDFPLDPARKSPTNRCYRNRGDWRFQDLTEAAGTRHAGYSAGVAVGDYDDDGFPDLYVGCYGPNVLFHNQGDGTFANVSDVSGTADDRWATSCAFFDYDADGLLDLYVGNYAQWTLESNPYCGDRQHGHRMFCGPTMVPPEVDVLYHNEGRGTFADASETSGVATQRGRAQGVLAADLNEDGWTDLYVTNDMHPNFLFANQKDGTFRGEGEVSGTAYDRSGKVQAGMGVTMADADRNGAFDLLVTNFEQEHNAYYQHDDAGFFFQDTAHLRGLAAESLPWIGWGTSFADFDLDGWPDVIVINGHTDDNLAEVGRQGEYAQPALLWHNVGGNFQFLGVDAGDYFQSPHPGRGLAIADLDDDGDRDVVCCHQDMAPELLCNCSLTSDAARACVRLRLIGRGANRDAVGTVVTWSPGSRTIMEQVISGGSYLSSSERAVVIVTSGIEPDSSIALTVRWPGGRRSTAATLPHRGRFVIIEPSDLDHQSCRVLLDPPAMAR